MILAKNVPSRLDSIGLGCYEVIKIKKLLRD